MPEYITDDVKISFDDSDIEDSMKQILMKKILMRKILMKKLSIECVYFYI